MTQSQIVAIASPILIFLAGLGVHYLAPATVAEVGTVLAIVIQLLQAIRNVFVIPPLTSSVRKTLGLPPLALFAIALVVLALCALLDGCLPVAATAPVTPTNQAQVNACQTVATEHNGLVAGGIIVGAIAPGLAAAATGLPSGDTGAKTALGVAAVVVGVAAVTGGGLSALTASSYASNQCAQVIGPLPAASARHGALELPPPPYEITMVTSRGAP